MFDYKSEDVVEQIVKAAKEDGVTIQTGYDAVSGALEQCMEVLKELKGRGWRSWYRLLVYQRIFLRWTVWK